MSHHPRRKENNCLNCGTTVIGPFCHHCGQENVVPRETAWQLIVHFFNDITHFDGKFFKTLNLLILRPGFLSQEYVAGRRASYLNPARMYIFTSFVFFLVFFSVNHPEDMVEVNGQPVGVADQKDVAELNTMIDSLRLVAEPAAKAHGKQVDTLTDSISTRKSKDDGLLMGKYRTREQYDSALQQGLEHDGWLVRQFNYKMIDVSQRYRNDDQKFLSDFFGQLQHSFPQLLFVSLPFMALFLKLLYARHKNYYYVGHAIFCVHFYIFVFIMLLLSIGIVQLQHVVGVKISVFNVLISIYIFFYLYKSMRNFYQQRRMKTVLKYFLFLLSLAFVTLFLLALFSILSFYKI